MSRIPGLRPFLLAAALALRAGPIQAEPILDQSFNPEPPPNEGFQSAGIGGGFDRAQTFTVGLGGLLTRVEVLLNRNEPNAGVLLFDVRPTSGGVPFADNTAALASLVVPAAVIPTTRQFVGFDLSPFGVFVAPGDVLSIVLHAPGQGAEYGVYGRIGDPYGRGAAFFRSPDFRSWTPQTSSGTGSDLGFRTFVDPSIVPEPPGLALLGTGALGLLGSTRWRIRATTGRLSTWRRRWSPGV